MRTLAFPTLFAAVVLTASCDRSARSGPDFVVRDSAGVTIVENRRPQPDMRLAWEIGAVPSLSIGGAVDDPGHDLFNVTDATRLADGAIMVADAGSGELRVFDASGVHRDSARLVDPSAASPQRFVAAQRDHANSALPELPPRN